MPEIYIHTVVCSLRLWWWSSPLPQPVPWDCLGSSMTGAAKACSRTICRPSTSMLPVWLETPPTAQARGGMEGSAVPACPSWLLFSPGTSGQPRPLFIALWVWGKEGCARGGGGGGQGVWWEDIVKAYHGYLIMLGVLGVREWREGLVMAGHDVRGHLQQAHRHTAASV